MTTTMLASTVTSNNSKNAAAMATSSSKQQFVKTLIVGGGHAGVNLACRLELDQKKRRDYLILEQADSLLPKWRTKRWDFFQLNAPVKHSRLYGQAVEHGGADERDDWRLDRPIQEDIDEWDKHIERVGVQYKLNASVRKVVHSDGVFVATVQEKGELTTYTATNLVVCSGLYGQSTVPRDLAAAIPSTIRQHVTGGLQLKDLQEGNVMIVGSGQSGCQVADLLLVREPGRKIFLCTSAAGACPRTYRGKDVFWWLDRMGFNTFPRAALAQLPPAQAESMRYNKAPVTGPNKAISPFGLHRQGVTLLGRIDSVEKKNLQSSLSVSSDTTSPGCIFGFRDDRGRNLQHTRNAYNNFLGKMNDFAKKQIEEEGETLEPDIPEPEWNNIEPELLEDPGMMELDADQYNVTNVIWAVGWDTDLSWLQVEGCREKDFDARTSLPDMIVSKSTPGLFYAGFPWIGTLQSMTIINMDQDTEIIADQLLD